MTTYKIQLTNTMKKFTLKAKYSNVQCSASSKQKRMENPGQKRCIMKCDLADPA